MKIAIIQFEEPISVEKLRKVMFPYYVTEKWCAGCKIIFISDFDYEIKRNIILDILERT